ncbi:MAG TPA: carboxypeptidase-like regulatory domain-containing protein [Terracidiphilus sp.]|nr:carboxypeptidase-like regulatory domain-containing protein [Terracidiphilus sp.]
MSFLNRGKAGIGTQRGYWLRCFLNAGILTAMCLGACGVLRAQQQLEPQGPLHLWRIQGYFVNETGKGIGNVQVTLQRDGQVVYKTSTDGSGRFGFEHVSGQYVLHIDKANYSQLSRPVIVGEEIAMRLRKSTLYVIAGPAQCSDDCSSVFRNKDDFDKAIKQNKDRLARSK